MAYRLKGKVLAFVRTQRVARLATVGSGRVPHNVPICTVNVSGHIYFASEKGARKVRNLRAHPTVSVEFDRYSEAWGQLAGAMITGVATIVDRGPTFTRARLALYRKYRQYQRVAPITEGESVIVRVTPTRCYSWGL
ncbi:MAG TPA: pyridoxamine 5'-phosphate oxidase family protein [Candidatus Binatia bacterium]|nr:pyridoxamine 5'-phosphate oxidase family protein [Candidatus Binatia bacterium]